MLHMNYDTHAAVKRLISSGLNEETAEAITAEIQEARDFDFSTLATKTELKAEIQGVKAEIKAETQTLRAEAQALRAELKAECQAIRTELTTRIDNSHKELMRWMFSGFLTIVGLIIALMIKLFH